MTDIKKSDNIYQKLAEIQAELKSPKARNNDFAGFVYRKAEDIIHAAKPLLLERGIALLLADDIEKIDDRFYVKATAGVYMMLENGETRNVSVTAYAREVAEKKGMDGAQVTGSASSYARKYALAGLFAVDNTDTHDPDQDHLQTKPPIIVQASAKKKVDPTLPTRNQLAELKDITKKLDLDEHNTPEFFQDAIGKPRPTTNADFKKSIEFGQTILADMQDSAEERMPPVS